MKDEIKKALEGVEITDKEKLALDKSIAHWEENERAVNNYNGDLWHPSDLRMIKRDSGDCALCTLHAREHAGEYCKRCVLYKSGYGCDNGLFNKGESSIWNLTNPAYYIDVKDWREAVKQMGDVLRTIKEVVG